ncbi:MAG: hypothetical protein AAB682_01870 [Patescibacteria group bacterium]
MIAMFEAFCVTSPKELVNDLVNWRVPVLAGATSNLVIKRFRALGVPVECSSEDFDKVAMKNSRDPKSGSYVVSFRRAREAPKAYRNFSGNQLADQKIDSITLLERLLLGFGFFFTMGKHLDTKSWTLCAGSRYRGGSVPCVRWRIDYRKVCVRWGGRDDASSDLGTRGVVSL